MGGLTSSCISYLNREETKEKLSNITFGISMTGFYFVLLFLRSQCQYDGMRCKLLSNLDN